MRVRAQAVVGEKKLLKIGQVADALGDGLELVVVEVPVGKGKKNELEKRTERRDESDAC